MRTRVVLFLLGLSLLAMASSRGGHPALILLKWLFPLSGITLFTYGVAAAGEMEIRLGWLQQRGWKAVLVGLAKLPRQAWALSTRFTSLPAHFRRP